MVVLTGNEYFPLCFLCIFYLELPKFAQAENFIEYLNLAADSFKNSFETVESRCNIVPGPFPVLQATYAKFFSIFEICGQS